MRIRIIIIPLLLLIIASEAGAQMREGMEAFQVSAVQASGDSGSVYVDLKIAIKYSRLVFFREEDEYRSKYRVFLQFYRGDSDRMIEGKVYSGEVRAGSYSETRSSKRVLNLSKKIFLDPGDYNIKIAIEVEGTRIRYTREISITLSESDIFISDPVFYVPADETYKSPPPAGEIRVTEAPDSDGFERRPRGVYTDPGLWLRGSINISSPASEGKVGVSVKILDSNDETVLYNREMFTVPSARNITLAVDINVDDYLPGRYALAVNASENGEKAGASDDFVVLFNSKSLTDNFEDALDLISLVASDEDIAVLAGASPSRRLEAWRTFWEGGNGYNLGEFREKIAYTARHFSGSRPGWESDMGKVYIRNGKPDRSVTRWSRWGGERYNFWYYYSLGIIYVFVDNFGTGDYRLIDTRNI